MKPVSLKDIARAYIADQECDLRDQLLISHFVEKAERELAKQEPTNVVPIGVSDKKRGWRVT